LSQSTSERLARAIQTEDSAAALALLEQFRNEFDAALPTSPTAATPGQLEEMARSLECLRESLNATRIQRAHLEEMHRQLPSPPLYETSSPTSPCSTSDWEG
jgi:hypothetical protein